MDSTTYAPYLQSISSDEIRWNFDGTKYYIFIRRDTYAADLVYDLDGNIVTCKETMVENGEFMTFVNTKGCKDRYRRITDIV